MTYSDLLSNLKTLGYPVVYDSFDDPQSPPFITILYRYNNDLKADNINYVDIKNFQIELYTKEYLPSVEKEVEDLLKSIRLVYEKSQVKSESEDLYQTIYEIKLI